MLILLRERGFDVLVESREGCASRVWGLRLLSIAGLESHLDGLDVGVPIFIASRGVSGHFACLLKDLLADYSGMGWLV